MANNCPGVDFFWVGNCIKSAIRSAKTVNKCGDTLGSDKVYLYLATNFAKLVEDVSGVFFLGSLEPLGEALIGRLIIQPISLELRSCLISPQTY